MKYKRWEAFGFGYSFKINYIDDVFDLERFKKRSFKNFKELLGKPTEREAKQIAKNVFTSFLKLMVDDLIENNEIFVFPIRTFGYTKISNTANTRRKDYVYDILSDGKIWTPKLFLDERILKNNKKHFKLRFNQNIRNRMRELIESGHKYR